MRGFTDIHHHLIFGMDDGPDSFKRTVAMLKKAYENGIARIIATPEVLPGMEEFSYRRYIKKLKMVQGYCRKNHVPMEIFGGAEILYTPEALSMLADQRIPTLADTAYVLVEFEPKIQYKEMRKAIRKLCSYGYKPVIAHVERYRCLMHHPDLAYQLKDDYEVYYQVNCNTILKAKGFFTRRSIWQMLEDEVIDFVASDAHNTRSRRVRMDDAYRVLRRKLGKEYADFLTGLGKQLDLD